MAIINYSLNRQPAPTLHLKPAEVTRESGTTFSSGGLEFNPVFSEVRVARSLAFCVMF